MSFVLRAMRGRFALAMLAALLAAPVARSPLWAGESEGDARVPSADATTWSENVSPIVKRACAGCHSGDSPKGEFRVDSLESFLAGGSNGATVVPEKPDASLVYRLITGAEKPFMPPRKADPLSEAEILTVRAWIAGGAKEGEKRDGDSPSLRALEPTLYPRPPIVTALAWSPDATRLYVSGYREILVHEVQRLAETRPDGVREVPPAARLAAEGERIQALALLDEGRKLVAAGGSPGRFGEVQLWDVEAGRLIVRRRVGSDIVYALALASGETRIVASGVTRALHALDGGTLEEIYTEEIHSDWVFGVAVLGERIFSGGRDRSLKVSALDSGTLHSTLATFDANITVVRARPGATEVLAADESGAARLFDAEKLAEKRKIESQGAAVFAGVYSADGARFALGGASPRVRVYSANGDREQELDSGGEWIFALAFDPSGERLAMGGFAGTVRVVAIASGEVLAENLPVELEMPVKERRQDSEGTVRE